MAQIACLHNISCASGSFAAQLRSRGTATRTVHRVEALSTGRRALYSGTSTLGSPTKAARSRQQFSSLRPQRPLNGAIQFNPLRRLLSRQLTKVATRAGFVVAAQAAIAEDAPSVEQISTSPFSFTGPHNELGWQTNFEEDYLLGTQLGEGSFGTVHLAYDRHTGAEVAVKVLQKTPAPKRGFRRASQRDKDRVLFKLRKEVEVLAKLQGKANAIELKGTYEDKNCAYIVMEKCEGGDFESYMESHGALSERQAALVMKECMQMIAACHEQDIYHGDVKPANFMLRDDIPLDKELDNGTGTTSATPLARLEQGTVESGWLKAIDFGCAQVVFEGVPLTRKTGTPIFMAPEVFIGNYGKEADLWALGIMLYQMLTNRFPWWNSIEELHSTTLEQVMRAVIMDDIPLDYGPFKGMSPDGLDLLQRLLERNPEKRISAAEALEHPWFQQHCGPPKKQPTPFANIVPIPRSMSDRLRLKFAAAQLHRHQSRADFPFVEPEPIHEEHSFAGQPQMGASM